MFFSRQSGSTLIEVLVAALVLGIGVMGLSAAQTRSLHEARQSWWQWQAQTLAVALIERTRATGALPSLEQRDAWRARVAERLPKGRAAVDWPTQPGAAGQVVIEWQAAADAPAEQLVLAFRQ